MYKNQMLAGLYRHAAETGDVALKTACLCAGLEQYPSYRPVASAILGSGPERIIRFILPGPAEKTDEEAGRASSSIPDGVQRLMGLGVSVLEHAVQETLHLLANIGDPGLTNLCVQVAARYDDDTGHVLNSMARSGHKSYVEILRDAYGRSDVYWLIQGYDSPHSVIIDELGSLANWVTGAKFDKAVQAAGRYCSDARVAVMKQMQEDPIEDMIEEFGFFYLIYLINKIDDDKVALVNIIGSMRGHAPSSDALRKELEKGIAFSHERDAPLHEVIRMMSCYSYWNGSTNRYAKKENWQWLRIMFPLGEKVAR
ncbi:MAG: hypothetical protein KJ709_04585 [Nanoarchaeota archaeon]|nr:hypothetical protein [Nanoarchaeota archaeon]